MLGGSLGQRIPEKNGEVIRYWYNQRKPTLLRTSNIGPIKHSTKDSPVTWQGHHVCVCVFLPEETEQFLGPLAGFAFGVPF